MSTSEKNRAVGQDNPSKNQHKPSPRTRLSSPISTSEVIGKIESFEFDCECSAQGFLNIILFRSSKLMTSIPHGPSVSAQKIIYKLEPTAIVQY